MAKNVKGNCAQSKSQGQNVYYVPVEVFKNERERWERGFPSEDCRYVSFGPSKKALVGFVKTQTEPNEAVVKELRNFINKQLNEWHRNTRCQVPNKKGILIRCPDCNKCSACPFGVKPEDRQLTVVNYSEPEELTEGISEIDDTETGMDLEVISKEINSKDPKAGRVFDLCVRQGYSLDDIAMMEGLTERQMRYIKNKIKQFGVSMTTV